HDDGGMHARQLRRRAAVLQCRVAAPASALELAPACAASDAVEHLRVTPRSDKGPQNSGRQTRWAVMHQCGRSCADVPRHTSNRMLPRWTVTAAAFHALARSTKKNPASRRGFSCRGG